MLTESQAIVVGEKAIGHVYTNGRVTLMNISRLPNRDYTTFENFIHEIIPSWNLKLSKSPIDVSIIVDLEEHKSVSFLQNKYAALSGPNKLCIVLSFYIIEGSRDNLEQFDQKMDLSGSLWMFLHDVGENIFGFGKFEYFQEYYAAVGQATTAFIQKNYVINNSAYSDSHIHYENFLGKIMTMASARNQDLSKQGMKEIYIELFVQIIVKGHIEFTKKLPESFVSGNNTYTINRNYVAQDIVELENQIQQIIIRMINNTRTKPFVFHP